MKTEETSERSLGRVAALETVRLGPNGRKLLSLSPRRTVILAARASLFPQSARPWRAKTIFGPRMFLTPPDIPSMWIGRYGYFEPSVMSLLSAAISSGDTVVDVGAHLGFFSLWSASLTGPDGTVLAIEPTPRTAVLLRRNVEDAAAPVTIVACAAYDRAGVLPFNDMGPAGAGYNGPVDDQPGRTTAQTLTGAVLSVPCLPLDLLLTEYPRVDCIKIDAEGSELAVLTGARATLERHRPHLVLETGDFDRPGRTRAAIDVITSLGDYEIFEANHDLRVVPHAPVDMYGYGNLLLSPRERSKIGSCLT